MIEQLNIKPRLRMVWGLFKGRGYFIQLKPDYQCGKNSRMGRIRGNMVLLYIHVKISESYNKMFTIVPKNWTTRLESLNVKTVIIAFLKLDC